MTDDALIQRVRQKEPAALAEFLELRKPALNAFVERRLGSQLKRKLDANDVLQELSVKALAELPKADLSVRDPFSWLCHLAEQCIIDGHRHFVAGKRDGKREVAGNVAIGDGSQDLIALLAASMTSPSMAVVRDERQQRLHDALASFSDEQREALRLRYGEGLSSKEVAERLKKSDVATRVLLTRLIHRLQELLQPGERTVEPG